MPSPVNFEFDLNSEDGILLDVTICEKGLVRTLPCGGVLTDVATLSMGSRLRHARDFSVVINYKRVTCRVAQYGSKPTVSLCSDFVGTAAQK